MSLGSGGFHTNVSAGFFQFSNIPKYCLHFSSTLSDFVTKEPLLFYGTNHVYFYPLLVKFIIYNDVLPILIVSNLFSISDKNNNDYLIQMYKNKQY